MPVRFTKEEQVELLLRQLKMERQYLKWEHASRELDWFSGEEPVPVRGETGVISHMPRALLLARNFGIAASAASTVNPKDLEDLIEAERRYKEAEKSFRDYQLVLNSKYGMGPWSRFDEDMGGCEHPTDQAQTADR